MAIKVIFASNSTSNATPNSSVVAAMSVGELFVNTADGKIWTKHSNGSLVEIITTGPPGPPGT
jgi:hypothetical protein